MAKNDINHDNPMPLKAAPIPHPDDAADHPKNPKNPSPNSGNQPSEDALDDRHLLVQLWRDSPSWLSSLVMHMVVLLILALWIIPAPEEPASAELLFSKTDAEADAPQDIEDPDDVPDFNLDEALDAPQPDTDIIEDIPSFSPYDDIEEAAASVELVEFGTELGPDSLLGDASGFEGNALSGRGHKARSRLVRRGGGGKGTEDAVALALKWLAAHQRADGSWSFDHQLGPCQGRCPNPGNLTTACNGATAIALLPFLGMGQTHLEGEYKDVVRRGLYFLTRSMKVTRNGGSLMDDGNMYSHGLGSIVLCEAYAMTQDRSLHQPAQLALNFIAYAQDPVGGGWRYRVQEPGDTSVVGWQIMALKSGHMSYLTVQASTVRGASKFLDSVQAESGSFYGYTEPARRTSTTAIGLLCRMYLGWKQDNPALQGGIAHLDQTGPSDTNFYYNYYATQVMFQYTGGKTSNPMWDRWNTKMKNQLLTTQAKEGHAAGSWFAGNDHCVQKGGRLYCTAMAAMILEVYYRHMPIYREEATTDDFPE
ncbi:MAG: terpene cyclase/mutase family protein [Pirellulales bacterium]|nr:terpene cyclase/mutase family protein [Pirellulales bacterium]